MAGPEPCRDDSVTDPDPVLASLPLCSSLPACSDIYEAQQAAWDLSLALGTASLAFGLGSLFSGPGVFALTLGSVILGRLRLA